jgi:deazaflavin-dependent oxidoreductase (nitroreductase family)
VGCGEGTDVQRKVRPLSDPAPEEEMTPADSREILNALARAQMCYLTTTGRVTGRPHTIEIWFALRERTLYFLAGDGRRSDWVRNISRSPDVRVRVGRRTVTGRGRIVTDPHEEQFARRIVYEKYAATYEGDLTEWRSTASPVAVDLYLEGDTPGTGR